MKRIIKSKLLFIVAFILLIAEFYFSFICPGILGPYAGSITTFIISVSGIIVLYFSLNHLQKLPSHDYFSEVNTTNRSKQTYVGYSIVIVASVFLIWFLQKNIFSVFDYSANSDIIPSIMIAGKRFLNHQLVYQTIHFPYYNYFPDYLPMRWLPYTVAIWFHFDPRWMAVTILFIGLIFYQRFLQTLCLPMWEFILKSLLPYLFLLFMIIYQPDILGNTVESMDAGYYLLFFYSLFFPSIWLRMVAIVFCLLSRYSLVLWVPLYLAVVFFNENKKNAIKIAAGIVIGVLVLYVIPFLSKDWSSFAQGQAYYRNAFVGGWQIETWQKHGDIPTWLGRGLGAAVFFYRFGPSDIATRLFLEQHYFKIASVLIVVACAAYFFKNRKRLDPQLFSLVSLKLYLTIFYTFLPVPYIYLFIVPSMLSVFAFALVQWKGAPGMIATIKMATG